MHNQFDKSVEEDNKVEYYENKIDNIENNNSISLDDPKAKEKLQDKLKKLEYEREIIKSRPHETWELQNIVFCF